MRSGRAEVLASRALVVSAMVVAAVGGCGRPSPDGVDAALRSAPGPAPSLRPVSSEEEALLGALAVALERAIQVRASAEASAENGASNREVLTKARRVYEGLGVGGRIPSARDGASVASAVRSAARSAGMSVRLGPIVPRPRVIRVLPEVAYTNDDSFRYAPDDLREVLDVTFELVPAEIDRLERFHASLAAPSPQRLVVLDEVRVPRPLGRRASRAHFAVKAHALAFTDVTPPRVAFREPTEDELLPASARLLLQRLAARPAVRDAVARLDAERARIRAVLPRVNQSLAPLAEANLWVARTAVLERAVAEVSARPVEAVLGGP